MQSPNPDKPVFRTKLGWCPEKIGGGFVRVYKDDDWIQTYEIPKGWEHMTEEEVKKEILKCHWSSWIYMGRKNFLCQGRKITKTTPTETSTTIEEVQP